jgi:hypothetical protein
MANTKISALTSSTTPLAGTEVLPIVQSSATVKVAVSNLTAGRSVSMSAGTISSGNLAFTSTAQRITADTANATIANRFALQDSTVNAQTIFSVFPNGTGTTSQIQLYNGTDTTNYARFNIFTSSASISFSQTVGGTGTYLPMTFSSGGSERLKIFTAGDVLVTSAGGGLGYGTGAGGTVTQATNKGTAVTLNKPTGQITMNNAALLPATEITFYLNNSLITTSDLVLINATSGYGSYDVRIVSVNTGNALIGVKNTTAGSLSDALPINFALIKGAIA